MNIPIQLTIDDIEYIALVAASDDAGMIDVAESLVMRGALILYSHNTPAMTTQDLVKEFAREVGEDMDIDLYVQAYAGLKGCTNIETAQNFFNQGLLHHRMTNPDQEITKQKILDAARYIKRRGGAGK